MLNNGLGSMWVWTFRHQVLQNVWLFMTIFENFSSMRHVVLQKVGLAVTTAVICLGNLLSLEQEPEFDGELY